MTVSCASAGMVQHLATGKVGDQSLAARDHCPADGLQDSMPPVCVLLSSSPAGCLAIVSCRSAHYAFQPIRGGHDCFYASQANIVPAPKGTFNAERGALSAHVVEEARRLHPDLITFHFSVTLEVRL